MTAHDPRTAWLSGGPATDPKPTTDSDEIANLRKTIATMREALKTANQKLIDADSPLNDPYEAESVAHEVEDILTNALALAPDDGMVLVRKDELLDLPHYLDVEKAVRAMIGETEG